MEKITATIDSELVLALDKLASKYSLSRSSCIRMILRKVLVSKGYITSLPMNEAGQQNPERGKIEGV